MEVLKVWLPIVNIIKESKNKNKENEKKDNIIKRAFREVIDFIKYVNDGIESRNPYK